MRPVAIVCLGVVLVLGCGGKPDTRRWPAGPDPPEGRVFHDGKKIPDDEVRVVTMREREAIAKLESSPWVEVTPEEAGKFVEQPVGGSGGHLVMLRAWTFDGSPSFSVWLHPDGVWVGHVAEGPRQEARRVVIARLPSLPSNAYFGIGIR